MNVLAIEGRQVQHQRQRRCPHRTTRMTEGLLDAVADLRDAFNPAQVSPAVAYLASEECALTGEIWSVGGGTVSRVFIGLAPGYAKKPAEGTNYDR